MGLEDFSPLTGYHKEKNMEHEMDTELIQGDLSAQDREGESQRERERARERERERERENIVVP